MLMGSVYKVASWKEFFTTILLLLFDLDPTILNLFAESGQTNRITIGKGGSQKSKELINNIYEFFVKSVYPYVLSLIMWYNSL